MEWINVEDKEPQDGQEVRFYTASNTAFNGWYYKDCFYRGDYPCWGYRQKCKSTGKAKYMARIFKTAVKGWMPLPEPPEQDNE